MCEAAIAGLAVKPEGFYLDGTFGRGGHAQALLRQLGPTGRLLVLDKDPEAIAVAHELAARDHRVEVHHGSFADMAMLPAVETGVDGVLLDLGVSSPQLDQPGRGFSFMSEGPLDMRMDPSRGQSVADWLARAGESEIADVLWLYGEEKSSRRIAKAIVTERSV
ncbi:MAG: 16S rRNA (cytosine(1402)-N(4))-methyltransferase RsmH, partial [Ahniella sp.]|nr:16S rRNA (cytosine(1402)-N(4))-methyltransferase RsmH [Ahniella sp.]